MESILVAGATNVQVRRSRPTTPRCTDFLENSYPFWDWAGERPVLQQRSTYPVTSIYLHAPSYGSEGWGSDPAERGQP